MNTIELETLSTLKTQLVNMDLAALMPRSALKFTKPVPSLIFKTFTNCKISLKPKFKMHTKKTKIVKI